MVSLQALSLLLQHCIGDRLLLCASASAAIEHLQPAMLNQPSIGVQSSCSRPTNRLPQAENTTDVVASEESQGKE